LENQKLLLGELEVQIVPCRQDNYCFLVNRLGQAECILIDASETDSILAAIQASGLTLTQIFLTHEHHDHIEGLDGLLASFPGITVSGIEGSSYAKDRFSDGKKLDFCGSPAIALHTPGHSNLCTSFYLANENILFTGDCLFSGGCGRVFGDTHEELFNSLSQLKKLPGETRIFCGHEYTETNLRFAQTIEPENNALSERLSCLLKDERSRGIPAELGLELTSNPFLRTEYSSVKLGAGINESASELETFIELRNLRNNFK